jgi:hypothetical protein
MTKKWIAITVLLLAVTAMLGWQLNRSVADFKAQNDLRGIRPVKDIRQTIVQDKTMPRPAPPKIYAPNEFNVIAENNAFSDSRSREEKADVAVSNEPPPLTQKPILVGVTIIDSSRRASIIDPTTPSQGRTRRAQLKRIGDIYHGYTISEIAPDYIVLESGTRREIIRVHEGSKKPQAGKTPILSTRVVNFGSGGAAGGTVPVTVASASPGSVSGRTSTPASANPSGAGAAPGVSGTTGPRAVQTGIQQAPTPPAPTTPQTGSQTPAVETDAQGRRVIRTPFGNIVRPNRE